MQLTRLAALMGVVASANAQGVALSSTVKEQCFTRYTSVKPANIQTLNWNTATTLTASLYKTITPMKTITPAAVTSTVTTSPLIENFVTAPTSTDTYTTSTTITTTTSLSVTEYYTQTTTSTTTQVVLSTTTVPVPAGFTGLGAMTNYHAKRDELEARASPKAQLIPVIPPLATNGVAKLNVLAAARAGTSAVQYPIQVQCTRTTSYFSTKTLIRIVPTSTTTLDAVTAFSTTVMPTTTTITVIPAKQTKIITISSDTSTIRTTTTSSITQTNTATATVLKASATFLAQCDTNNRISQAVGQKIGTVSFNPSFILQSVYVNDDSGYACCATCAADPKCAGYAQKPGGGACYYITTDGRCDPQQSWSDRFHYYMTNGNGYTVGNGQCGFLGPQAGPPSVSS